ncbi:hypothetical protein [Subtercola sp. YIM 133946]|uniref:hypothetical protein n=1 Tax=Subtercola sp. YIM 133946 TaxID=3118909 RepID=UPI002F959F04
MSSPRERALAEGRTAAWEWDLAVDLGYQPESWTGMWKLIPHPFTITADGVTAVEIEYEPGTMKAIWADGHPVTHEVHHPLPAGWKVITVASFTRLPAYFAHKDQE